MNLIEKAFGDDPQLAQRIRDHDRARADPEYSKLIRDISEYILKRRGVDTAEDQSSPSKKRKLENGDAAVAFTASGSVGAPHRTYPYSCEGVSVAVPMRKKLKLQFCVDAADAARSSLDLLHPTSDTHEYSLAGADVEVAFCLPVPDKQARQWNFVVIPTLGAQRRAHEPVEPLVFTLNEPKHAGEASAPDDIALTERHLNAMLQPFGKCVTRTCDAEFHSAMPQPHRKNEKAYHVSAHRGSKEGYLFFLPNGILFGFKKPLAFFPFVAVESISYTSVLQRTFNLVIAASEDMSGGAAAAGDESQALPDVREVEFSMLDQADFAGIDAYVKRHGLNDASMAAARRAKAYNVNKETKKVLDENGDVVAQGEEEEEEGGDAGMMRANGDAAKTEQQLQDEEDELEEDYEASEGESDAEGEYSEEEEEGGEGDGDEEGDEEGDEGGEEYD